MPSSQPPERRRRSDVEKVVDPLEEERPIRPADPFRSITNQLAISDEDSRRALQESSSVGDRRAIESVGADLRAILSKAIDHISRARAGSGHELVDLRKNPARNVEMSALRGIVVTEELATLMDMPVEDINEVLGEVLDEGRLDPDKRRDVLDLLRTLRSTVTE